MHTIAGLTMSKGTNKALIRCDKALGANPIMKMFLRSGCVGLQAFLYSKKGVLLSNDLWQPNMPIDKIVLIRWHFYRCHYDTKYKTLFNQGDLRRGFLI